MYSYDDFTTSHTCFSTDFIKIEIFNIYNIRIVVFPHIFINFTKSTFTGTNTKSIYVFTPFRYYIAGDSAKVIFEYIFVFFSEISLSRIFHSETSGNRGSGSDQWMRNWAST